MTPEKASGRICPGVRPGFTEEIRMAQSEEWKSMQLELKRLVIPDLRKTGFTGSFPHFRRTRGNKTELISFLSHNQYGGGFEVGASVIFPDAFGTPASNLFYPDKPIDPKKLMWCDGRIRNSLSSPLYDGVFYYADVYCMNIQSITQTHETHSLKVYIAVTPKHPYLAEELKSNPSCQLVQKADSGIYTRVAGDVVRQMPKLLSWFDTIQSYNDLLAFKNRKATGNAPSQQQ